MAEGDSAHAMVDLEKELSCSICTDLLYQPLTLLDCLHTFCGACLKEWFQFQASTATSLHPYTCPSCRASVRGTKPNATVTTLLDMFLQANPGRGKSEADKTNDREKYKPGDNVLPKLRRREEPGAEEDRRLMEEVQQISLREVGISNNLEPPRERRRGDRSRERSRESRRRDREGHRSTSRNHRETSSSRRETTPSRTVEHQSSLRSLLSSSEIDSQEIEEEIMRQIMEEGLLDGIDLNNINVEQEDQISERIAQAYRRRQRERQRERQERRERLAREGRIDSTMSPPASNEIRSPPISDSEQPPRRRPHGRSPSSALAPQTHSSSRPPVSRPGLIDAANQGGRSHGRSSSQSSSTSTNRANRPASLSVTSARQASRSTSELSERPGTSGSANSGRRRLSENQQRSTLEERQQFRASINSRPSSNPNSPRRSAFNINAESPSSGSGAVVPPSSTVVPPPASRRTTDPTHTRQSRLSNTGIYSPTLGPSRATTDPAATEPTSRASSMTNTPAPTLYPEPEISCNRCGKKHLEYDLHFNCSRCDGGNYNLCSRCYHSGRGCKHWYGFGWAAWPRYERLAPPEGYPPNHEHPHILVGRRYQRTTHQPVEPPNSPSQRMVTESDPATRLEAGVFCAICLAFANSCYWKCDVCNEGDWGFCNDCVNQGKHCTHDLLPVHNPRSRNARSGGNAESASPPSTPRLDKNSLNPPEHTSPPLTPRTASLIRGPGHITIANAVFRPLTFTSTCNICTYPIPPSHTRFHCPECNDGNYDICTSCYHKLVSTGRISTENGMNGWRRCLRGHRMVVVGFEDRGGGQRRIVTRDLVGGHALKEETIPQDQDASNPPSSNQSNPLSLPTLSPNWSWRDTDGSIQKQRSTISTSPSSSPNRSQQRFPPDGGIGLRVQGLWSYYPEDGVKDELMFPKGAEIREAEDINGDWFWGCYAGAKGLFPGNYGRLIR